MGAGPQDVCQGEGPDARGRGHRGGEIKGAVTLIARLTYRQRYEKRPGREPLRCPHCRGEMGGRLWHPTYGVIQDEGQMIRRGL